MPEEIALFIDFENIRYSMLNIQRREPDPQELIAVARRYGTVMVARAYADWSRQPEPFKGSLTAAMIDRVDCPAKQRDRIRMGTVHYPATGSPTGALGSSGLGTEQGTGAYPRQWPSGPLSHSGPLPAISASGAGNEWSGYNDSPEPRQPETDDSLLEDSEPLTEEGYIPEYPQREPTRQFQPFTAYGQAGPSGSFNPGSNTGPLGYPAYPPATSVVHSGNTGHLPAVGASGSNTVVQSTVVQSTVDLNMLMDIIETVFDRPTISTFVLMTGDKDFTRISARLKLRLNKTVIVVGIPGTVSRDLVSSANQFVPLIPGGNPALSGQLADNGYTSNAPMTGNTGSMAAINPAMSGLSGQQYAVSAVYPMDVLDPQFLQFLDYIDRNWSWRTIIGVSNFIGDPVNPKNRFRGRLTRESARELLNTCIQQGVLLVQTDPGGAEDLRLNRQHPGVDEVLKQFVR